MKRPVCTLLSLLAGLFLNVSCAKIAPAKAQVPDVPRKFEIEVLGSVSTSEGTTTSTESGNDTPPGTEALAQETGSEESSTEQTASSEEQTTEEQATESATSEETTGGEATSEMPPVEGHTILVRYRASALGGQALPGEALKLVPGLRKVELPAGETVEDGIRRYQADPRVLYAEPDEMVYSQTFPTNDPQIHQQIYLFDYFGQTRTEAVWEQRTDSCNQVVAVVDTGLDTNHIEISRNVWRNPNELLNGLDDDGNGLIDDINGYDFFNDDSIPDDENGHGTFVSGVIGAVGNNGLGVAGVTWCVQIMPLKVFGPDGRGPTSLVIQAIDYAISKGVRVSNHSHGTYADSQSLRDAIARARDAGHLVIAAAGNDNLNTDIHPVLPASSPLDNVVSVGAVDTIGGKADFSNFGPDSVDLFAPGVLILSLFPDNFLARGNGTSFAAPLVTGVAALLMEENPELNYRQVRDLLIHSGRPSPYLKGLSVSDSILSASAAFYPKLKLATGAGETGGPHVRGYDSTGALVIDRFAYDPAFDGGVRVAVGDVNADGLPDMITGSGYGSTHVRVIDGRTGALSPGFHAYPGFTGGVNVASGDVDGDGFEDIITGAGAGGGPHIKVYSGRDGRLLRDFFVDYIGNRGVRVGTAHFNGDDHSDIIVGPGPGAGPQEVRVYDGKHLGLMYVRTPYPGFGGGMYVAGGDFDGDGRAEIVTGAGGAPGGGPHVKVENPITGQFYYDNFPYDVEFEGGVRVGVGDYNGDGRADLATAAGPGGGPHVRVIDVVHSHVPFDLFPFNPAFTGGAFGAL